MKTPQKTPLQMMREMIGGSPRMVTSLPLLLLNPLGQKNLLLDHHLLLLFSLLLPLLLPEESRGTKVQRILGLRCPLHQSQD